MRFFTGSARGFLFCVALAGCGTGGSNHDGGPAPDAGGNGSDGGGADAGSDAGEYPAPHLAPALMVYGGDRLLYAPKVVTVTFAGDNNASSFETFDDTLVATPWWDKVSQGYCGPGGTPCIGRGSSAGHVRLTSAAASSYTDTASTDGGTSSIKDLVRQNVANGTFPAPDADTLYVIYFPAGTTVTLSDQGQSASSCTAFGGYHSHVPVSLNGQTHDVAYAIIPQCPLLQLLGMPTTVAASHETIEAATDPFPSDVAANGYYMDPTRDAWLAITAAEVGDVCALLQAFQGLAVSPPPNPPANVCTESSYTVQRSFSNASVLAGHDPCVPALPGPYFNVAPSVEKLVLHTGQSQTIPLTGFSDGPTADWNVKVVDFGQVMNPFAQPVLGLQLDRATANNGTTLHLTVTVNGTVDPNNGAPYVIISTSADGSHVGFWPGIVETH